MKYVCQDQDRYGNVRVYFRRPGERKIRLRASPGEAAFDEQYQAAMAMPVVGRKDTGSVVYFVRSGEALKIGLTSDLPQRLQTLQNASATRLVLLLTLPGDIKVERHYHSKFAHLRLEGEWFRAAEELTRFLVAERQRLRWRATKLGGQRDHKRNADVPLENASKKVGRMDGKT